MSGRKITGVLFCLVAAAGVVLLVQGGSLDPPGLPAPTKTAMDETDPRIPIRAADLPITISEPGSYYLVEHAEVPLVSTAIEITASDVTIDLMGFCLRDGFGDAIIASGAIQNIEIRNGTIEGWGSSGIDLSQAAHFKILDVRSVSNDDWGILAGNHGIIRGCVVARNGFGSYSAGGIGVGDDTLVANNVCEGNLWGIELRGAGSRVEENHLYQNDEGIVDYSTGGGNVVVRNSVGASFVVDYDIASGNAVGPIGSAAGSTSPWSNIQF